MTLVSGTSNGALGAQVAEIVSERLSDESNTTIVPSQGAKKVQRRQRLNGVGKNVYTFLHIHKLAAWL